MTHFDKIFAAEIESTLKKARYRVIADLRDEKPRPACVFMAERRNKRDSQAIHLNVFCCDGEWTATTWWFRGNLARLEIPERFTTAAELVEIAERPWRPTGAH